MEARKAPEVLPRGGFRHSLASIRASRRRGSRVSLIVAFVANLLVAAAKLAAGFITGSAALLAEAAHSAADSTNEILLGVSFRRARRPPDAEHPFGYGACGSSGPSSRPSPRF
jgi:divalent metal cation (Fe/Co/Zn/Cd) transporter